MDLVNKSGKKEGHIFHCYSTFTLFYRFFYIRTFFENFLLTFIAHTRHEG